jgi:F-type H+-transporting ATPase subunit b
VWAASEGGHESGGLISLDKSLIVQAINFLILLFILQRLLYKPFLAKMGERTAAIQKSLDEAQAARAEATRQQEENETRLRAAHAEAAAIRAQAMKEASEEQKRLVEAARAESQRLVESAKAQMEADVRRAREELRREVADLATAVAEKLVRRSLRDEDHRRIVADAITKVGN